MSGAATAQVIEIEPEPPEIIDWEAVFEAEGDGLIALINEAKSIAALKGCMAVIVEQLFSRKGDAEFRESYLADLDAALPDDLDGRGDVPETLKKLIAVMTLSLRKIKTYRIKKAEEARRARLAAGAEPRASAERRTETGEDAAMLTDAAGAADETAEDEEAAGTELAVTEKIFAEVVAAEYKIRFKALQMGINQKSGAKTKLPFMLSADFANKFDQVLCQYLIPELTRRCQEIVTRGAKRAAAKQKSYLQQFTGFEGGRGEIWEHWRQTWTDMTAKQKLPTRPTGKGGTKKKKGLFGMPLKKTGRRGRCGEGRDRPLEGPDRPIGKDQRPCGCGLGYPLRGFRPLPAAGPRYRRQAFDGPLRTQHQEHHETGSRHQPDREPRRGTGPCLRGFANRQGYRDLPAGRLFPEPRALSRAQTDPQAIVGRL